MAASTIKLKLLIDTKAKKVILAEAGKDFIDFLIYLLSLPLATVTRLLKEKNLVGNSLSYLYESIENLPDSCLQPNRTKDSLLNHRAHLSATGIPLKLSDNDLTNRYAYRCNQQNHYYVADVVNLSYPACNQKMIYSLSYVHPYPLNTGFIRGSSVTYLVLDNLEFMPMSIECFVTLLKKLKTNEVGALEEIAVDLGKEEGLKLLKLSLECNTVLTSFYQGIVKPKV